MDLDCNWSNVRSDEKERRLLLRVWNVTPEIRAQLDFFAGLVNHTIALNEPDCDVLFEVVMDEGPRYINTCDGSSGSFAPFAALMTTSQQEVAD